MFGVHSIQTMVEIYKSQGAYFRGASKLTTTQETPKKATETPKNTPKHTLISQGLVKTPKAPLPHGRPLQSQNQTKFYNTSNKINFYYICIFV